ncbi:MAG TPA: IgGFc-binding protein [Polyangiaceae bacterium]|nr:IgGFc-binding protein [Polyangiaceae bacterium]
MVELRLRWWAPLALAFGSTLACSAGGGGKSDSPGGGATSSTGSTTSMGGALNLSGTGPSIGGLGPIGGDGPIEGDVPATCTQAAAKRTYIGCDFWPTITFNPVYTEFDFAVVIANSGAETAMIEVTGPAGFAASESIPAGELKAITLPWVPGLKGPEFSRVNTSEGRVKESARVDGGAYHVVSSIPVTAWQFNPLQYSKPKAAFSACATTFNTESCFSASNDASLLVPSTAMTGNYTVFGRSGIFGGAAGMAFTSASSGVAITATQPNTQVKLQFPADCGAGSFSGTPGGCVAMGTGVMAANGGTQAEYTLNAGDVLELVGVFAAGDSLTHADLSGTVINATQPVQVVAFNPIANIPDTATNADHVEETVLPAEVIGDKYVVAPPTSPNGAVKGGHVVRIYGNFDATTLTYAPAAPAGAPTTIGAGKYVEFGPVTEPFTVEGSEPFVVASFMVGGSLQAPPGDKCPDFPCRGDPSMSMEVTPRQFRSSYTFLAPADYETNFADILVPADTTVTLDDAPLTGAPQAIGATGWSVIREPLKPTGGGVHKLSANKGVGLQVMGFGHASSYYYPGGLNLELISKPPVVK